MRNIYKASNFIVPTEIPNVFDDSNDLAECVLITPGPDSLSKRVLVGEHPAGQRAVDNYHLGGVGCILPGEVSTLEQVGAGCSEVSRAHHVPLRGIIEP